MHLAPRIIPFLLVALAGLPVDAAGLTGILDGLEGELNSRRAALAGQTDKASAKAVKQIDKALGILGKPSLGETYPGELKGAAKAGKIIEKKLRSEAPLQALLAQAAAAYTDLLTPARDRLALAAAEQGLAKKEAKRLAKNVKKADKGLAAAASTASSSRRLGHLTKVAKAVSGFIEGDTGITATWVLSKITVAPPGEGLDLDGDGKVDNQLGAAAPLLMGMGLDLDKTFADGLAESDQVALLQMWEIDDFDLDPEVRAGLVNGVDTDFDPTDNFSGNETFDVKDGMEVDGHPSLRARTSLAAGGAYEVEVKGEEVSLVGFDLPPGVTYRVKGTARPASNAGMIGLALPVDLIFDFIAAQGIVLPFGADFLIRGMADIDLDGDNVADAISAAFLFDSVTAFVR